MVHRVLVTGSAGAVGQAACKALMARGHFVRGFDRKPTPGVSESIEGNVADQAAVAGAVAGVDTVIHLAAYPNDADFMTVLLEPNVVGLYQVFAESARAGVGRVIVASSMQVVQGWIKDLDARLLDPTRPTRPCNHYSLAKVWAESMGEMYARCHQMSVLAIRLGFLPRTPREVGGIKNSPKARDYFLSHDDAGRFFVCAVEAAAPAAGQFAAVFVASHAISVPMFDLQPTAELVGYQPQDRFPQGLPFDVPE